MAFPFFVNLCYSKYRCNNEVNDMLLEDIKKYCLGKHKAYEECPFGDIPICYKLNGKIFAQIYPYEVD